MGSGWLSGPQRPAGAGGRRERSPLPFLAAISRLPSQHPLFKAKPQSSHASYLRAFSRLHG